MTQSLAAAPAGFALWRRPYVLLTLTALIWAGHSVVGKLAVGEIGPLTPTFLRWTLALGPILWAARNTLAQDLPELRRRWLYVASLGALGYTLFNALFYVSAYYTSALNMALIQASIPALVLIGAALGFGARPTWAQALGAAATMAGVAVIAAQGDWRRLVALAFNRGDAILLIACVFYAYYTLGLRKRPPVATISLLAALASAAFLTSIPPAILEISRDGFQTPSPTGFAVLLYAALGPAFASQMFFMRGVELIGPGRAGVFVNLVPIFGAAMAAALLGEPLARYDLLSAALVLGGIGLAQLKRKRDTTS